MSKIMRMVCILDEKRRRGKPAPDACWGVGTMCPMCHNYKAKKSIRTPRKRR